MRLFEPPSVFGFSICSGDPGKQRGFREAQHVADGFCRRGSYAPSGRARAGRGGRAGPRVRRVRWRASLTNPDTSSAKNLHRKAVRRRSSDRTSMSGTRARPLKACLDGLGCDAAKQRVDRLADQAAAELRAEIRKRARRPGRAAFHRPCSRRSSPPRRRVLSGSSEEAAARRIPLFTSARYTTSV